MSRKEDLQRLEGELAKDFNEENDAARHYEALSFEAKRLDLTEIAGTLQEMSIEERKHHDAIDSMLRKVASNISAEIARGEIVPVHAPFKQGDKVKIIKTGITCTVEEVQERYGGWWAYLYCISKDSIMGTVEQKSWFKVEELESTYQEKEPRKFRDPEEAKRLWSQVDKAENESNTYEMTKKHIYGLAEKLHDLVYEDQKRQNPSFGEETWQLWSKVVISEKRDWFYMDVHGTRFSIGKYTGDTYKDNILIGKIATLTAQDLFKAM